MNNEELMKACQRGIGNYPSALDDANNLLAECYRSIGELVGGLSDRDALISKQLLEIEGLKQSLAKAEEHSVRASKILWMSEQRNMTCIASTIGNMHNQNDHAVIANNAIEKMIASASHQK